MKLTSDNQQPTSNIQWSRRSPLALDVGWSMLDVSARANRKSSTCRDSTQTRQVVNHKSAGMALVITLILLSIITFMTVVFLVITQRERGSVATTTDSTTARFAVDAALARAEAQLIAPILALTNDQAYDLIVSTNYINGAGFETAKTTNDPYNVNYDYTTLGNTLSAPQMLQNLANLQYDARVPVYRMNLVRNTNENQFYLDLNRNGIYDTNGWGPVLSGIASFPFYDTNGNPVSTLSGQIVLSNFFVGDPEWIGQLEHPDQPHSGTNQFTSRIAYIAVPVSKTLDINYIHNQVFNPSLDIANDGFFRNSGAGSWEINLAAFLADLNTNQWDNSISGAYFYNRAFTAFANNGAAFRDAFSILTNRYAANYNTLDTIQNLYGASGVLAVQNGGPDDYADGPLQITTAITNDNDNASVHWAGADNTNHFFTTQDLFDPNKSSIFFVSRLKQAGATNSSYDRYTFYRLLSQLGTDSTPESGKININYVNVDNAGNVVPSLTQNFIPWSPLQFFTNAADKMLRTYTTEWFKAGPSNYLATFYGISTNYYYVNDSQIITNDPNGIGLTNIPLFGMTNTIPSFGVRNIPIYIHGRSTYSPNVHRILQLAANMYDATTNRTDSGYPYLPSVFRPVFHSDGETNVFIAGYTNSLNATTEWEKIPYIEAVNVPTNPAVIINRNVYGIPWIIGAKKGLPNFNEYDLQTEIAVTRKLRLVKPTPSTAVNQTNQMYLLQVENKSYLEAWNSYAAAFPRDVQIRYTNEVTVMLTNEFGETLMANRYITGGFTNIPANGWLGLPTDSSSPERSFIPFFADVTITNATYLQNARRLIPQTGNFSVNPPNQFPVPHWWVVITNRLRCCIIDNTHQQFIDFVNLEKVNEAFDITTALKGAENCDPNDPASKGGNQIYVFWCTNRFNNSSSPTALNYGVYNQIIGSLGGFEVFDWNSWSDGTIRINDKEAALARFLAFMLGDIGTNNLQTPFNPTRRLYLYTAWQANDPLVHYTVDDLTVSTNWIPTFGDGMIAAHTPFLTNGAAEIQTINSRYSPWNYRDEPFRTDLRAKDPLVTRSDRWDFPTNKFSNVGLLGRVHRGTPWQTVYLKASDPDILNWTYWMGYSTTNQAALSEPAQDRPLFDLFTTAINGNATRGQLSANQSGIAAWSALLTGVVTLTNSLADDDFPANAAPQFVYDPITIQPAGVYSLVNPSPVARIVQGINHTRSAVNAAGINLFPNKLFTHAGDVLATPELTEQSPFLNYLTAIQVQRGISDEAYERIPQQIMSLVTLDHEPRFVIYAFGQTLRPAPNSIVRSGPFYGLCTNYQVTAEMATRAVVRIQNPPRPGSTNTAPRVVVESYNIIPPD